MKVIDLLNKIANNEQPLKIVLNNETLIWDKERHTYQGKNYSAICWDWYIEENKLNDEVEIIEEDKKIEKIISTSLKGITDLDEKIEIAHIDTISAIDKINELIDEINKLKENK